MKKEYAPMAIWRVAQKLKMLGDEVLSGALLEAHEALTKSTKPDPETGLVKCGCGGAVVMRSAMEYSDHCVECKKCDIGTPWYKTAKEARNAWNLSHGYKEDNDGL